MVITFKGKEVELKYTFNSFRYMEEFDINDLSILDRKPFKLIGVLEELLMGALNNSPNTVYNKEDILVYIEEEMENGGISELLTGLVDQLEKSNFFKNLQKSDKKPKKK